MTIYSLLQALDAESSEANGAHSLLDSVIVSFRSLPRNLDGFINYNLEYIHERWKKELGRRR